ncbi:RNA chaperone Hfq [Priestia koreensis]|uniref:RNA chaperone Hfq n=1 Tax=Priestia koreensis TaxID=284581 RepID=UPI00333F8CE2
MKKFIQEDIYLAAARSQNARVTIITTKGVQIKGQVVAFDQSSILLRIKVRKQN